LSKALFQARLDQLSSDYQQLIARNNHKADNGNGIYGLFCTERKDPNAPKVDTTHVAATTIDKLLDYAVNTPEDGFRSYASVKKRNELIAQNLKLMKENNISL
jgi:hypothetical protein